MSIRTFAVAAMSAISLGALAEPAAISNVKLSMTGWPWNKAPEARLTFTVGAGDPVDVEVSATWDGQSAPVDLVAKGAVRNLDVYNTGVGTHTANIDLSRLFTPGDRVSNFKVSVTGVDKKDHVYLVLNLANGTFTWRSQEPNFSSAYAYYDQYLVFRRVLAGPVGTYTNGIPSAVRCKMHDNPATAPGDINNVPVPQAVGFSKDYFISTTFITGAHATRLGMKASGQEATVWKRSQNALRGMSSAEVNWPVTGFGVKNDSDIAKARSQLAGWLPKGSSGWVLDLPTHAQLETAARAGTWQTFWWNGGTKDDGDNLTNVCTAAGNTWGAHNYTTHPGDYRTGRSDSVGAIPMVDGANPHPWGMWEPQGNGEIYQYLDINGSVGTACTYGMDPVGPVDNSPVEGTAIKINGVSNVWGMMGTLPSRSYGGTRKQSTSFRLVLNTANWPGQPLLVD